MGECGYDGRGLDEDRRALPRLSISPRVSKVVNGGKTDRRSSSTMRQRGPGDAKTWIHGPGCGLAAS